MHILNFELGCTRIYESEFYIHDQDLSDLSKLAIFLASHFKPYLERLFAPARCPNVSYTYRQNKEGKTTDSSHFINISPFTQFYGCSQNFKFLIFKTDFLPASD